MKDVRLTVKAEPTLYLEMALLVIASPVLNFVFSRYTLGKCDVPLGMEDRRVPDQLVTASSFYNYYCGPRNARLHQRRVGRLGGAWCVKRSDRRQWLKIDFGGLTRVSRIATQGRQNSAQWVTSYYVSYSTKGYRFVTYKENRRTKVSVKYHKGVKVLDRPTPTPLCGFAFAKSNKFSLFLVCLGAIFLFCMM